MATSFQSYRYLRKIKTDSDAVTNYLTSDVQNSINDLAYVDGWRDIGRKRAKACTRRARSASHARQEGGKKILFFSCPSRRA